MAALTVLLAGFLVSAVCEYACENYIHIREVMAEIETSVDILFAEELADVRVRFQRLLKIRAGIPCLHGIALNEAIGVLACHAFTGERQQHAPE